MINTSSHNSSSESYSTKPQWGCMLIGIISGTCCLYYEINKVELDLNPFIPGAYLVLALLCFILVVYHYSISFDFSRDGIVKRVCMLPVRRISWEQVQHILFFHRNPKDRLSQPAFALMLDNYPKHPTERESFMGGLRHLWFQFSHPRNVKYGLIYYEEEENEALETIKMLYGRPVEEIWDGRCAK